MKAHRAAELFPLMDAADLRALAEDIKQHGQKEPIAMLGEQILDGRNRWLACEQIGAKPWTVEVSINGDSAVAYVISKNLVRRHLTASQRAAIAVEALPLYRAEAKERQREHGGTAPGRSKNTSDKPDRSVGLARDAAAEALGASGTYVEDAGQVKRADPEAFERIKDGTLSVWKAVENLRAPKPGAKRSLTCSQCGKEFPYRPRGKFCSAACVGASRRRAEQRCEWCGKSFIPSTRSARFCSRSCGASAKRGPGSKAGAIVQRITTQLVTGAEALGRLAWDDVTEGDVQALRAAAAQMSNATRRIKAGGRVA